MLNQEVCYWTVSVSYIDTELNNCSQHLLHADRFCWVIIETEVNGGERVCGGDVPEILLTDASLFSL